ncbi:MAG: hypothetical protein GY851_20005, partial [bacterium]|nr:hypothetical protein [bacterium]
QGIAADGPGNVYVSDWENHRIQKFDSDGAFLTKWGDWGAADGKLIQPQGTAVDGSGNVYVADFENNRIQKFDANGAFLSKWGNWGTGDGQFRKPSDVAVDGSGNVYVADFWNSRVQRFDSDGTYLGKWGSAGSGDGQLREHYGITVDGSGNVYVVDSGNQRIQKFDADGTFLTKWGSAGTGDGQFHWPRDIAIGPDGAVYIADGINDRIQKFDPSGAFLTKWGTDGSADGQLRGARGVAVDSSGVVYVADAGNRRIQKFSSDGTFLSKWGSEGSGEGQFNSPGDIAVNGSGIVYVADAGNNCIQKFDADGAFLVKWGSWVPGGGEMNLPRGVAVDGSGNVYVADWFEDCVQKFDSDGAFLTKWGSSGTGDGRFATPHSVAADGSGNVYVTDCNNHRIQKFDTEGNFLVKWGTRGSGDGQFEGPTGIAVDGTGNVYVAEWGNHRIQKFDASGAFLTKWGSSGTGDGQFSALWGIAVDGSGRVYVSDTYNNRIQKFRPIVLTDRAKAIVVAGGGPFPGNSLWNATVGSTNYAYAALTSQAFTKETIHYLSADTDLDLDNNGVADDVDGDCTKANLQSALLTWAPAELGGLPTGDVVLYLVDHGGPDTFRISETEVLTSAELAPWLDTLEAQIQGKLIVVVDACYCGSFIDDLSSPGRIVIASAAADEEARFQRSVSFSDYFWTRVFAGDTVQAAFDVGVEGMALQTPMLDDNGNGTANDATDGAVASVTHIGTGTQNTFNAPVISAAVGDHTLTGTATTTLWADVTDTDGVASVWAVILPPDAASATSYPSEPLWPDTGARWENTVDVFTTEGTYTVLLYARDRIGSTSAPSVVEVTVGSPLRRKALVVAGVSDAASTRWPGIEYAADQAYRALKGQSYSDDDIYYLSASGTVGVDGSATWNNVRYAIETWAATNTHDLVVYLVGEGTPGAFTLNATEAVTTAELDGWLDTLQGTLPGGVVVLADVDYAGAMLPDLMPPADKDRIVIASTGASDPMRMLYGGAVSFSTYFWAEVLNGAKVGPAYSYAAVAMLYAAGASSMLDDTGDGLFNLKGDDPDGVYSRAYRIGSGILLAGDEP